MSEEVKNENDNTYSKETPKFLELGIIGILLIFVGVFLPVTSFMGMSINYIKHSDIWLILLISNILSIIFLMKQEYKNLTISNYVCLAVVIFDILRFEYMVNDMKYRITEIPTDSFASGLINIAASGIMESVNIEYGIFVMLIGCILVLITAISNKKPVNANETQS